MPKARAISCLEKLSLGALMLGFFTTMPAQSEKPVLTVYTYSSFSGEYGPGGKIEAAFEKTCGCDLVFVGLEDTGAMLARLKLEGEATKADIVLGLDSSQMPQAAAFAAPHGLAVNGLTLPVPWQDSQFMPFDWGHIAMIYDSDKLKTPPASLRALIEDAAGPRIIVQDPRTSAPGFGFLLWMRNVFGDEAPAAWTKLLPRIVTFTKGWSEAYDLFLKGEADMVVSYTTSPAYHIAAEGKTNYKAAIFAEGHYLQIEVMAAMKAARDPALAKSFLAFMLSEEAQSLLPEGNFMFPAKLDPAKLPASLKALAMPQKALSLPPAEVEEKRRAFLDEWLAATTQ
jgi:thiamine transport system substrate-binding protein